MLELFCFFSSSLLNASQDSLQVTEHLSSRLGSRASSPGTVLRDVKAKLHKYVLMKTAGSAVHRRFLAGCSNYTNRFLHEKSCQLVLISSIASEGMQEWRAMILATRNHVARVDVV